MRLRADVFSSVPADKVALNHMFFGLIHANMRQNSAVQACKLQAFCI